MRYAGPGIIWAMSAIGQTHVVLSTYAGTRFGFDLLWMVVLAHALTYPVFEFGARYAIATGHSLNHAYLEMRGMRWIMVPFLGFLLLAVPFLLVASLGSVTASVLLAAFPSAGFATWAGLVAAGTAALLFGGRYRWLERLNVAMAAILLGGVAVAFGLELPDGGALVSGLVPVLPAGALVTLVALMRLPSDAGSSILLSSWALQRREAAPEDSPAEVMSGILFGLRCGYGLSLGVSIAFLSLGATVLRPRGVDLEGVDLALQLSRVFTETVGAWTFPLFIVVIFVALFSGYYAAADGVPRVLQDLVVRVRPPGAARWPTRLKGAHAVLLLAGGFAITVGLERPAFLVLLAVSLGLVGFPLIYGLNLFAVTRMIAPEFRPHAVTVGVGFLGILFAVTGTALLFFTRVLS